MSHLLRLTWLLLTAPFRKPLADMLQPSRLCMRVWPTDLDILMHMNNGVYLSLLDLGRIDLLLKARAYFKITRKGMYPVVASEMIRFRKSLRPFQAFEILTKMHGWDEKFFYLRQDFVVKGEIHASALIKGCFLKKGGGKVTTKELFQVTEMQPHENVSSAIKSMELIKSLEEELRD